MGVRSTTEALDPVTNTWSPSPNLSVGRFGCAVLTLSNNRILVLGGRSSTDYDRPALPTSEIIDLEQETSAPGPGVICPRYSFSAVILHDGRVLIIGPDMDTSRYGTAAILLPEDGGVLIIGG